MQINIKVYFFESIGATFNWSGVLIEQCHGNSILHMPIKDYRNCFFFVFFFVLKNVDGNQGSKNNVSFLFPSRHLPAQS